MHTQIVDVTVSVSTVAKTTNQLSKPFHFARLGCTFLGYYTICKIRATILSCINQHIAPCHRLQSEVGESVAYLTTSWLIANIKCDFVLKIP